MQGEDLREGVLVCAKHFLGYAVTDAGQNMAATAVGPRELYDVYARPFEAAIRLAGLAGVMASYSEFEGVPIHVSRAVLTDMLRGRMGFTGTVVSDYNGVGWAQTRQLVAPSPEDVGALALAAAHADVEQYARSEYGAVSLADAVRKLLPDAEVRTVAGTGVLPAQPTDIPAALAAARDADVVILYIGGKGGWYGDDLTEKEGGDTADIDLPQQQVELVNAVTAVGKPTVAVVSMGRPQGLAAVIDKLPAVLTAYYGGPHQGSALADAIFGITNPEGKLPITIPRHVGQVPIHHGQKWGSGYRRTKADIHPGYLDMPSTPLFAFGHGLSYTTFDYGPLELESDTVDVSGELRLSLAVTNTGKQRGTEIVQLYAADMATGVTLPAQQLIGFARLDLEPGTSKTVAFTVPMSLLAYTGLSGDLVMEPGPVEVSAGSSSSDIRSSATFSVTGQTRLIEGADRAFLSVATVGT
jgi:beta-glucosidase